MLTWDCFRVLYSKYSSQKENIPSGDILTFYQGKKCLNCAHFFHVLHDIFKLLVDYSAGKTLLKCTAIELGSRTIVYIVLAVQKLLDRTKELECREAAPASVGDAWGPFWHWQQTPTKAKKRRHFWSLERTVKIYCSSKSYWNLSDRKAWEKDQRTDNIASVGDI